MEGNDERARDPEYTSCINKILTFRAPEEVPKINILLFGGADAGKSSIVSTVDSLFKGRISRRAAHLRGSRQRTLRKYSFNVERPGANGTLETQEAPFVLWDSAAGSSVYSDYKCGELGYILDGNLPNRFDLSQAISPQSQHFITSPHQADRVHCMCFVVPCDFAASCDRGYLVRVREMKEYAMDHGIPTLVFLTKVDEYDSDVAANISMTKYSQAIKRVMRDVARVTGISGTKDVFPMKSFSSEYEPDKGVGILILRALQHALYAAVDYLEGAQEGFINGRPPLPVPQQGPRSAHALATGTASTECDQEIEDWEAVPKKQGNPSAEDEGVGDRSKDAATD